MLTSTDGIVLRQRKIANNRRMITLFTRKYGRISAGTSISETGKGKSALALRPFTYADYNIFKGRDYYNIDSATVKRSYYAIGEDLDRFMTASTLITYLDKILEEGQAKPKLFDMTLEFFECIGEASAGCETLLYAFIIKTLRMQGIMPELSCCVNCGKPAEEFGYGPDGRFRQFSVTSGGIICDECASTEKGTPGALIYRPSFDIITTIGYFLDKPLRTFGKVSLKTEVSRQLREILAEYLSHYLNVDVLRDDADWRQTDGY